ncbi:hypothetical protein KC19_12G116600 [Ceratodon purpureus]|uniref:Uncharacterized protein n=1 Tax=Ceratodon purpureus TaxID=3225 RepID=A0A8T0G661_CERPU|nr:hypothetical protein KC19_12G116500 [Ceratodon purpureus]KAG0554763.1 hypothetical protein KC19_12G116600 [Ceratodon purpureus]
MVEEILVQDGGPLTIWSHSGMTAFKHSPLHKSFIYIELHHSSLILLKKFLNRSQPRKRTSMMGSLSHHSHYSTSGRPRPKKQHFLSPLMWGFVTASGPPLRATFNVQKANVPSPGSSPIYRRP